MDTLLGLLSAVCGPAGVAAGGALLSGLLLAGLAGSVAHCGPMCGPFVLGQVADRMTRIPAARMCESARLQGALLLPYHLGRLATYAALGALAASLGAGLWSPGFAAVALLAASAFFAAQGLGRLVPRLAVALPVPSGWSGLIGQASRSVDRTHWSGGVLLGAALGLLPCGLLYGALLAAAGSGSALAGAAAMLAFGLGTVPMLIAIGLAGRAAGRQMQGAVLRAAPVLLLLNAGVLAFLALRLLAS